VASAYVEINSLVAGGGESSREELLTHPNPGFKINIKTIRRKRRREREQAFVIVHSVRVARFLYVGLGETP
jgi:hypothetical protein